MHRLLLVELTVCFETGFDEAADQKQRRYLDLLEDAKAKGYRSQFIPIQMGSRGIIDEQGFDDFKSCLKPIPPGEWKIFLEDMVTVTIQESHRIWCDRNHQT